MNANFIAFLLTILLLLTSKAEVHFKVSTSIQGLDAHDDLLKTNTPLQENVACPIFHVLPGEWAQVETYREFIFPASYDQKGSPTQFDTAKLGYTIGLKAFLIEEKIKFHGSIKVMELADGEKLSPGIPSILSSEKFFHASCKPDKKTLISFVTPKGKPASLTLTFQLTK